MSIPHQICPPHHTVRRLIETGCNTTLRYIDIKLPRISIQQARA